MRTIFQTNLLFVVFLAGCVFLGAGGAVAERPLSGFLLFAGSQVLLYVLVFHFVPERKRTLVFSLTGIFLIAILLRLCFLAYPPSDDVNRYVWEGKVVTQGGNPYVTAPNDLAEAFPQDRFFARINHPDVPTAYPPVALLSMAGVSSAAYTPMAFKIFALIVDLCVIAVLVLLLRVLALPMYFLALYALNPLVLYAGAGEGHIDVLQVFFIALALLLYLRLQKLDLSSKSYALHATGCFLALGAAVMTKYLALLMLPFLVTRRNWRFLPVMLMPFVLFLPFWEEGMFRGVVRFSGFMAYNDVIPKLLRIGLEGTPYMLVLLLVFCVGLGMIWLIGQGNFLGSVTGAWIWCLVCLPCVHIWYLMPLVLLAAVYPRRSLFFLFGAVGLGFWVLHHQAQTGQWQEFWWIWGGTYVPFLALLAAEWNPVNAPWQKKNKPVTSIDLVIPTFNEGGRIRTLLSELSEAVGRLQDVHWQIWVVDGGSTDSTVANVAEYPWVNILHSEKGRGEQMQAGVRSGSGDLVLMLHADTEIRSDALEKLVVWTARKPAVVWGVLGHGYDKAGARMGVVMLLNTLRFYFFGLAFGDQGIFVRRDFLDEVVGIPEIPLMEDVELSLRLQQYPRGRVGRMLQVSARRWLQTSFGRYFLEVASKVLHYLLMRRLGMDTGRLASRMYQSYYGKRKDERC